MCTDLSYHLGWPSSAPDRSTPAAVSVSAEMEIACLSYISEKHLSLSNVPISHHSIPFPPPPHTYHRQTIITNSPIDASSGISVSCLHLMLPFHRAPPFSTYWWWTGINFTKYCFWSETEWNRNESDVGTPLPLLVTNGKWKYTTPPFSNQWEMKVIWVTTPPFSTVLAINGKWKWYGYTILQY